MERILLTHWRAPGDIVCMTASVRDLALSFPGKYEIHVAGSCPDLWQSNPHVAGVWGARPPRGMRRLRLDCHDYFAESEHTKLHYLTSFHRSLGKQLGVTVPVLYPHGDLHLSDEERAAPPVQGRYWLVIAGGKSDMTTKIWPQDRFQEVVKVLRRRGIQCAQAGATLPGHWHPVLNGVNSFVGKTDRRGFLSLVYHADGVICPVTFAMHAAAAFHKRCVVLAGGREPWWWQAYLNSPDQHFGHQCQPVAVPHRYLHTIGVLDCCQSTGCWRTHVLSKVGVSPEQLCLLPVTDGQGNAGPRCLDLLSPNDVIEAVESYFDRGRAASDVLAPLRWKESVDVAS